MTRFVALLRAVNVGGTGKLPMADLRRLCEDAGFAAVRTYLASGNVVFRADGAEADVKATIEAGLHAFAGKPVGVLVRTADAMADVAAGNPFPDAAPDRTMAIFLDEPPAPDAIEAATGRRGEALHLGAREIYVHYPDGMGRTTLRIPAARHGTARNMSTVAALAGMAAGLG